jgi:hypothetical protein
MLHSIAGPVTLRWTITRSQPPLFSRGPISHIMDFIEDYHVHIALYLQWA